jgi:hypothetical protein
LKSIETRNQQNGETKSPNQAKSQPTDLNRSLSPEENKCGNSFAFQIPLDEVAKAPSLQLTVIESATLQAGALFDINAQGLKGSKRQSNDGVVYIGLDTKNVNRLFRVHLWGMT